MFGFTAIFAAVNEVVASLKRFAGSINRMADAVDSGSDVLETHLTLNHRSDPQVLAVEAPEEVPTGPESSAPVRVKPSRSNGKRV